MPADQTPRAEPIAVIGMGCRFPKAASIEEFWNNIKRGVDGISEVPDTHWSPDDYFDPDPKSPDMTYARRGGFIDPVDFYPLEFGIVPNALEATDTTQLIGMLVARDALRDSGYDPGAESFPRDRAAVIMGVTSALELLIPLGARLGHPIWKRALADAGVDEATARDVVERISQGYVPWQEASFPGLLGNVAAGRIANRFNLHGSNAVVDAACASSLSAIHMACMELESGRADIAVSGGLDTFNDIFMYMCFSKTPALSPGGNSRPFDRDADGTILGEGLGVLVLKRLRDAERDGDKIYAVIKGIGSSSDGRGNAIYAPSAEGQSRALRHAYQLAGISPASIQLIEAHGTGTKVGDAIELKALCEVYGEAQATGSWAGIGSIKSMVGHTKAAAGVAGLIKVVKALHARTLPPTIKVETPAEAIEPGSAPIYANTETRPWIPLKSEPRRAAISAFGFGGSNYHAVVEEYRSNNPDPDFSGDVQILAFSAATGPELQSELDVLGDDHSWYQIRELSYTTRNAFVSAAQWRLLLVVERGADLAKLLKSAEGLIDKAKYLGGSQNLATPDGVFLGVGPVAGTLGLLFPGQGSQRINMCRDLACIFPEFQDTMASANATLGQAMQGERLSDLIYPIPVFSDEARAAQEATLTQTQNAQPALGAAGLATLRVLERFGVSALASAGHSYGELVALCAAGRINETKLFSLSRRRGELMSAGSGDRGSMLALQADVNEVDAFIKEENLDLVLANRNMPTQAVLSGASADIDRAADLAKQRGWRATKLKVAAAFHSRFVADAVGPFSDALGSASFASGATPVFANTTAAPYPTEPAAARDLLANQLAKPVNFIGVIEAMHDAGVRTFVECGPGTVLTGMVGRILDGKAQLAVATDASRGRKSGEVDLAKTLAQIAAAGHAINLTPWDSAFDPARMAPLKERGPAFKLSGANYRAPYTPKAPVEKSTAPREAVNVAKAIPANPVASSPAPTDTGTDQLVDTGPTVTSIETSMSSEQPAPTSGEPPLPANAADSMRIAQESLQALMRLQDQTAKLHEQFLAAQDEAADTVERLLNMHQGFLESAESALFNGKASGGKASEASPQAQASASSPAPEVDTSLETIALPANGNDRTIVAHRNTEHVHNTTSASVDIARAAKVLTDVVADKTGYPVEMLELEMELDADLGIDSIKRVEILSAVQEQLPDLKAVEPERLGSFQTLRDVVEYMSLELRSTRTQVAKPPQVVSPQRTTSRVDKSASAAPQAQPDLSSHPTTKVLLEVVADKTGYPPEMLELPMELDADLGIDSIKRVEILSAMQERLPDVKAVEPDQLGSFQTLADVASYLAAGQDGASAAAIEPAASEPAPVVPTLDEYRSKTPEETTHNSTAASVVIAKANKVLNEVVAEKTGYPEEMLEPQMELDADLGIDSIKRVEILSALQEKLPEVPAVEPDQLGSFHTLRDVVEYIASHMKSAEAPKPTQRVHKDNQPKRRTSKRAVATSPSDAAAQVMKDTDRTPPQATKVEARPSTTPPTPRSMTSGGVTPGARLAKAAAKNPGLHRALLQPRQLQLDTQRQETPLPYGAPIWVSCVGGDLSQLICDRLTNQGFDAQVIDLANATPPERLACLVIPMPEHANAESVSASFALIRNCERALRHERNQGNAKIVGITQMGGQFGLDAGDIDFAPDAGALCGIVKTAGDEWPEVRCQMIDVMPISMNHPRTMAAGIVDEMLLAGPSEVGIRSGYVYSLSLKESGVERKPAEEAPLGEGDLVVVTGGARGVTAECAVAMAEAFKCTLLLIGRTKTPQREEAWLAGLRSEKEIKQEVLKQEPGLKPLDLEERYKEIRNNREMLETTARIHAAGGQTLYASIDVRDADGLEAVIESAREEYGPVKGIVHGAGILADRLIGDQKDEDFQRVYQVKVEGFDNLINACANDPIKVICGFSSTTARFGRKGQVAYAAANEALNKRCQLLANRFPKARVCAINWGPWDGGMVTPQLRRIFEREGIGLIGLKEGARFLVDELCEEPATAVEVVAIKGQDRPASSTSASELKAGGAKLDTTVRLRSALQPASVVSEPAPQVPALERAFEVALELREYPFLKSHVLNGQATLPVAMMMEWFAQAALKNNPGLYLAGIRNLSVKRGVTLGRDETIHLAFLASDSARDDGLHSVQVELRSGDRIHADASVLLVESTSDLRGEYQMLELENPSGIRNPYEEGILFHGTHFQGIRGISGLDDQGVVCQVLSAPSPSHWMMSPMRAHWLTDPMAVDCALQACILWAERQTRQASLPTSIGAYAQYQQAFPAEGCRLQVRAHFENAHTTLASAEFIDASGTLVAALEDIRMTLSPSLAEAFQKNRL